MSGVLSKKVLGDFLESECLRQLYLSLGKERKKWGLNRYSITELERERIGPYIMKIGKDYEQKVYKTLQKGDPSCLEMNQRKTKKRNTPQFTKDFLLNMYQKIQYTPYIAECCLLEYDFKTPKEFILSLFDIHPHKDRDGAQEPPTDYTRSLRPDIMLIGNRAGHKRNDIGDILEEKKPILMMNSDGEVQEVPVAVQRKQLGINIIDVKATREEKIGKRHFFEIIFYWKALAMYLRKIGLEDKFYVRVDYNGIFPGYSDLSDLNVSNIRDHIVELPFEDTLVLYDHIAETLTDLFEALPRDIEEIPIRLQPICARCEYLDDCKKQLKYGNKHPRKEWDLCLLPYMSQNISEELKDLEHPSFDTIEDVANRITDYESESVPTPLFAEKPFLKYRARSLLRNEMVTPEAGEVSSIAFPKKNPISLILDFETDPLHKIVCAVSFNLSIFLGSWHDCYNVFEQWWTVWKQYIDKKLSEQEALRQLEKYFDVIDLSNPNIQEQLVEFKNSLNYLIDLRKNTKWPWLTLAKKAKRGKSSYHRLNLRFALLNEDFTRKSENQLAEQLIPLLYAIITFMQTLEYFLSMEDESLNSAVYYWSWIQMEHLHEFLERNLDYINDDLSLHKKMLYIIRWFNPSESSVEHPYYHQKVYDLRTFAENTISLPLIINYTWHEVAHYLSTRPEFKKYFGGREQKFSYIFWNPHFNYIDFQQWYKYITLQKSHQKGKAAKQRKKIILQMLRKVRIINRLRKVFQDIGKHFIAGYNKPKPMEDFYNFDLKEGSHQIAQMWYLFEEYTSARDELEKNKLRSLFPEFGIGRLESAKTKELTMQPVPKGDSLQFSYEFQLRGVSSNVKIGEGEWVNLIPELVRHQPNYKLRHWKVVIERMEWKDDHWQVVTRPWKNNILKHYLKSLKSQKKYVDSTLKHKYQEKIKLLKRKLLNSDGYSKKIAIRDTFHLYPRASSPWKNKLKDLFKHYDYGVSWLGKVLAYKWNITNQKELTYPQNHPYSSWLPDVYMYAPYLLPEFQEHSGPLLSSIAPQPDDSQKEALIESFNRPIYGIQGPPGTGKSQTIAALIDEFILRNKDQKPLKILVTTFSYAALRVVFQNIVNSKNQDGTTTEAARCTCAFMRSRDREAPSIDKTFWDLTFTDKHKILSAERIPGSADPVQEGKHDIISRDTPDKLESVICEESSNLILFSNAHQLVHLQDTCSVKLRFIKPNFQFDLIVVDEASQLPVNYFLASLQYVKKYEVHITSSNPNAQPGNSIDDLKELEDLYIKRVSNGEEFQLSDLTNVIIVGDQKQLPPVQPIKPPKKLEPILDNLFGYYCDYHEVSSKQLEFNYRSNQKIVDFTNFLHIYDNEIIAKTNKDAQIVQDFDKIAIWNSKHSFKVPRYIREVLDSSIIMGTFIHEKKYETAVSELE
ncbi:MAG: AAA domain-containing protein, partial [Promethearchaeia archaeon]